MTQPVSSWSLYFKSFSENKLDKTIGRLLKNSFIYIILTGYTKCAMNFSLGFKIVQSYNAA